MCAPVREGELTTKSNRRGQKRKIKSECIKSQEMMCGEAATWQRLPRFDATYIERICLYLFYTLLASLFFLLNRSLILSLPQSAETASSRSYNENDLYSIKRTLMMKTTDEANRAHKKRKYLSTDCQLLNGCIKVSNMKAIPNGLEMSGSPNEIAEWPQKRESAQMCAHSLSFYLIRKCFLVKH